MLEHLVILGVSLVFFAFAIYYLGFSNVFPLSGICSFEFGRDITRGILPCELRGLALGWSDGLVHFGSVLSAIGLFVAARSILKLVSGARR